MITIKLLALIVTTSALTIDLTLQCKCSQLTIQADCNSGKSCLWDLATSVCKTNTITSNQYYEYCNQFNASECNQIEGCAFLDGRCTHFSGCSAYKRSSNSQCYSISQICISDGYKCVEKSECGMYKTEIPCLVNYVGGKIQGYCFWNRFSYPPVCQRATTCVQLPNIMKSDAECRAELSYCALHDQGGCQESGVNCADQKNETSCVENRARTMKCFWEEVCKNRICSQAPTSLVTDAQCTEFLSTCTTKKDGGCIIRGTCGQNLIEAGCFTNSKGELCFWDDGKCKDKVCASANADRITNEQCQGILKTCITKFGGGCTDIGECEQSTNRQACNVDLNGKSCFWNGFQCKSRICSNASDTITTSEDCSKFLPGCTLKSTGKGCVTADCYQITEQGKCKTDSYNNQCFWKDTCEVRTCDNAPKNENYDTHTECEQYLSNCTVSTDKIGCTVKLATCALYQQNQCNVTLDGTLCWWVSNTCGIKSCTLAPVGNNNTHQKCTDFMSKCTVNATNNGCIDKYYYCRSYTSQEQCLFDKFNNNCDWADGKCGQRQCSAVPANLDYSTNTLCEGYASYCTVGLRKKGLGCVNNPQTCDLLLQTQCTISNDGSACFWDTVKSKCIKKECSNYVGTINYYNCNNWLSTCSVGPGEYPQVCALKPATCTTTGVTEKQCQFDAAGRTCVWLLGACRDKSCTNIKTYSLFTPSAIACANWLPTCLYYNNECTSLPATCTTPGVVQSLCQKDLNGKDCVWDGTACGERTCANKGTATTNQQCVDWLNTCVINGTENGCMTKLTSCGSYLVQAQCASILNGNQCFLLNNICTQKSCSNKTSNYTHLECQAWVSSCTVGQQTNPTSCMNKEASCTGYLFEAACVVDMTGTQCFWNGTACLVRDCSHAIENTTYDSEAKCKAFLGKCTVSPMGNCIDKAVNCSDYKQDQCYSDSQKRLCYWKLSTSQCLLKTCANADITLYNDHTTCQGYSKECTFAIAPINNCIDLKPTCPDYVLQSSCYITSNQTKCIFRQSCIQAQCTDAEPLINYNTHIKCQQYMTTCTVNKTGQGCIQLLQNCSDYQTLEQCGVTLKGQYCNWNTVYNRCMIRGCSNAPLTAITNAQCNSFLSECYIQPYKCKILTCEEFPYDTDQQCRASMLSCTTNGYYCVTRKHCSQITSPDGCQIDSKQTVCQWNYSTNTCVTKSCETAPIAQYIEAECEKYYPYHNCTPKTGGGCITKSTCENQLIQTACTTSLTKQLCVWENLKCRSSTCYDFIKTTTPECNEKLAGCLSNGVRCVEPIVCSKFVDEKLCLLGSDGPCKWINNLCYMFKKCESLQFQSHSQCQKASTSCTSTGLNCIPLNICSEYYQPVSCVMGIDGNCTWNQVTSKCSLFTKCEDYNFTTHSQCTKVSIQCTTNQIDSCIGLLSCSDYTTQEVCQLDKLGRVVENNKVMMTGNCYWDQICKNEDCSRLSGTTHQECNSKLSSCTSDGQKCQFMMACSDYKTPQLCSLLIGKEGNCFYSGNCQPVTCAQLVSGSCASYQHLDCINDSDKCQDRLKCNQYTSQDSCQQGGKDGQCLWYSNKCGLITSCETIVSNSGVCAQHSECYWEGEQCKQHSCASLTAQSKACTNIKLLNTNSMILCQVKDRECVESNTSTLNIDECYKNTVGTYRWNKSQCESCTSKPIVDDVNPTPPDETTKATLLYFIWIILLMIN